MRPRAMSIGLLVLIAAAMACDKGEPDAKGSGKPSTAEASMLANLPSGNTALFGGNYLRFQKHLADSPLGKLMQGLDKQAPGMTEWMNCFIEIKGVEMLSGVMVAVKVVEMRFAMKGISLDQIEACAKRAGYATTIDPDKKFLGTEIRTVAGAYKTGYLVLPSGALYGKQRMEIGRTTVPESTDRGMLEADAALIAKSTAANDTKLVAEMNNADRTKAIWFVGNGEGTPLADKVGLVRGWLDIEGGLSMDFLVQIKDSKLADTISEGVPQAKKQAGSLGPELSKVINKLQFSRNGDRLRFAIAVSNDEIQSLVQTLGPMMGGSLQ
jgi:hypothetical protein